LDWEEKKAYVRSVDVDYYTDASLAVRLAVLDEFANGSGRSWGEVTVTYLATIFKKIKLETHENVGWGKIRLPEDSFHTTAYWLTLSSVEPHWTSAEVERGLAGVGHVVANVAPLFLMCDPRDIGVYVETRSPFNGKPTLYLYDSIPGGIGFAENLFASHEQLVASAESLVARCPCDAGCPSCVGAPVGDDESAKSIALGLLRSIRLTLDRPH
jgi:DEAD/DEAH box helicase domain-containing protein